MNIGLFGGTFDPPHTGHIAAARSAAAELQLDKLILMPSGVPPHKRLPEDSAPPECRLEMAGLCASFLGAEAWDWELDGQVHYTADTVKRLKSVFPEDRLWLLVGADMFLSIETWYRPEEIFKTVSIGAFARADGQESALSMHADKLRGKTEIKIIPLAAVDISSTALRPLLAKGGGEPYVLPEVWRYIKRHGLYAAAR